MEMEGQGHSLCQNQDGSWGVEVEHVTDMKDLLLSLRFVAQ